MVLGNVPPLPNGHSQNRVLELMAKPFLFWILIFLKSSFFVVLSYSNWQGAQHWRMFKWVTIALVHWLADSLPKYHSRYLATSPLSPSPPSLPSPLRCSAPLAPVNIVLRSRKKCGGVKGYDWSNVLKLPQNNYCMNPKINSNSVFSIDSMHSSHE